MSKAPQHLIDTAIHKVKNRGLEFMGCSPNDIKRLREIAISAIKGYREARDAEKNYQKMREETITWLEENGIYCNEYKKL